MIAFGNQNSAFPIGNQQLKSNPEQKVWVQMKPEAYQLDEIPS